MILAALSLLGPALAAPDRVDNRLRPGEICLQGRLTALTPYRSPTGEVVGGFIVLQVTRYETASGRGEDLDGARPRSARLGPATELVAKDRLMRLGAMDEIELSDYQAMSGKVVRLLGTPSNSGGPFRLRRIVFPSGKAP